PVNAASRRRRWPKASVYRGLSSRQNRQPRSVRGGIGHAPVVNVHWSGRQAPPDMRGFSPPPTQALGRDGNALAQRLRGYTMSMAGQFHGLIHAERAGRGGRYDARATLPKFYLVGDSHCVAPAATIVSITGRPHRVTPLYVLGCKAWHLTTALPNPYKEAVLRAAQTIPAGSQVIFTAGDIDCRFESGFHNLYRKTGAALDRAIDQTVGAYLDQLRMLFPAERHRLSILAPP